MVEAAGQEPLVCVTIEATDGWIICPSCRKKKLLHVRSVTRAEHLEVVCRQCREVIELNIVEPAPLSLRH